MKKGASLCPLRLVWEDRPKYDLTNRARLAPCRAMAENPRKFLTLREEH
jgi:hypothetical protein